MNGRSNSFRLRHWQLAERQRYLNELETLGARLRADAASLRTEIELTAGSATLPVSGRADPLFIRPLLDRREKLEHSIEEIEQQIAEARQAVVASQQEVKLVESAGVHRGLKFEERLTRRARRST